MEVRTGYKQTDVGVIPVDWNVVSVGELASFASGNGIKVGSLCGESSDTPVPVFGGNGIAGFTDAPLVRKPTVVVGRVGQKCGEVYLTSGPAWITDNALYPRTIHREFDVRFLALALGGAALNDVKNRNDLPLVTQTILHSVRIPWTHHIEEQRAIARALSDVDALLNGLERLIAKKRDLKQAAMQQLLTGQTRLPGFHGKWTETTLGEIGECIIGLTYSPSNVVEHGLLVLRSSNIQNGRLAYDDNVYVNINIPDELVTRPGDILVCTRNGSRALIGKCAAIDDIAAGSTFGAFMSVYRTKHWQFITHAFKSDYIQRQVRENIGATINQITNKDMKAFRVKLPPDDEQTAIATILSDMDAELSALESRRDKTRTLKQAMMQELLTGKTRLVAPSSTVIASDTP